MADTPHTPPGQPAPGGGHGHGHNDPMAQLWMAMSGASAGHHEEVPGVDVKSAKVGHEPDQFDARTIIYVPIVVAITLVVTYLIVQGAFAFVNGKEARQDPELTTDSTDPAEQERIKKENEKRVKPRNELSGGIGTWGAKSPPKATPGEQTLAPVPQPQLEANRQVNTTRRNADNKDVADPPFIRSFFATGKHNSPVIYPEDLRPANFRDPWQNDAKLLAEPKWVVKDKLAVVPIDEMIHMVAHDDKWKDVLKVAEKPAAVNPGTLGKPKMSAGGLTGPLPVAGEKKDDGHGH